MKRRTGARVVLVTCGSLSEGRKIARAVVTKRLAACVNVISAPVESIYRWKGKVERAREILVVMKTTVARLPALEGLDYELARDRTAMAACAVRDGSAGYALMVAESPSG